MRLRSLRQVVAIALAAVVAASVAEQKAADLPQRRKIPLQQILQNRDLKKYDDGGESSSVSFRDHGKLPNITALRVFIWTHWEQKKFGYVRLALTGIDNTNTSYIFIEPREDGRWHIAWRRVNEQGLIPPPPDTLSDEPEITSVERGKHKKDDWPGGEYVLVFRNEAGKEIQRL